MPENIPMIRLTGVWKKKSKTGTTYYTAQLTPTCRINIFLNDSSKSESAPDGAIYLAVEGQTKNPQNQSDSSSTAKTAPDNHPNHSTDSTEDDIYWDPSWDECPF
jgi:hypothetical protein